MNCSDCRERLVEYLLDEVDESEANAIAKHLSEGCGVCTAEFNALVESIELLYEAAPSVELTAERRAKILEASIASSAAVGQRIRPASPSSKTRWLQCIAATAAGFAFCFVAIPRETPDESVAVNPAESIDSLNQPGNAVFERVEQLPSVALVSLDRSRLGNLPMPHVVGAVVVDQLSNQLHMIGRHVGPRGDGMQEYLIIHTAEEVFTYEIELSGQDIFKTIVPLPVGAIEEVGLVAKEDVGVETPASDIET